MALSRFSIENLQAGIRAIGSMLELSLAVAFFMMTEASGLITAWMCIEMNGCGCRC
jgi:hypothetical protein